MKILLIGSDRELFKPSSAVAQRMIKYGELAGQISVVVFTAQKFQPVVLSDKVKVYPTNSSSKLGYVFDAIKIGARIVKERGIEVISTQDPFEAGLVGYWLKKRFAVALNLQIHGDFFSGNYYWRAYWLNKIRLLIAKIVLPHADSIRVVSRRLADSLAKLKVKSEKIVIVPIYVDTGKLVQEPVTIDLHQEFPGKFIILAVGRLVKEKNLNLLIETVSRLTKENHQVALAIVGGGKEENNLKSDVRRLKLEDKVKFYGWQENLGTFYKTADVLVITSQAEGYNRTAIEAMSCGLPVIMTDVGLAGEIIKDGFNGKVLATASPTELAQTIQDLIRNPESRLLLGQNALATIKSLPNQEQNLALYLQSWQLAKENHERK